MSNKLLMTLSVLVIVFATALPAYAQTPAPSVPTNNPGFLGEIASFFGNLFHHQNGQNGTMMQGRGQGMPMQGVTPGQPAPSGVAGPDPGGQPGFQSMQQYRLTRLVDEGKITQTQEQEILTELTTVQSQLTAWAQSEGINPSYVLGGPMMMGSIQQQNGTSSSVNSQGQGQMHPVFRYQGGYGQGSQQGGGQPPQQQQGQ